MMLRVCLLLALAGGELAVRADSPVLKWKFKEGDVFYVRSQTDLDQVMTVMGQDVNQQMTQVMVTRYTVKKALPDGGVVLTQEVVDAVSRGNMAASSDKIKGVVFTVTLNNDHQLVKFEGYKEFLDKASAGDPQARQTLADILNEDVFKQTIAEMFTQMPGSPVAGGSTWTRKSKVAMGPIGDLATASTYKYEGKHTLGERPVERITFSAEAKFTPPGDRPGNLPFKVTGGDLKSKEFKGTLYFDADLGRLAETSMTMSLAGDLTFNIQGMELAVTLKQKQTITSKVSSKELKVD